MPPGRYNGRMSDQARHWSKAAENYEKEFIDPYRPDVRSPLPDFLSSIAGAGEKVAADLGCGIGPLLPLLAKHFRRVWAVDFAEGMLARARQQSGMPAHVTFLQRSLLDLRPLHGKLDVAVAVNSLVMPDVRDLETALARGSPLPAARGRRSSAFCRRWTRSTTTPCCCSSGPCRVGQPLEAAARTPPTTASTTATISRSVSFAYRGLEQHFWQPFEVRYR